MHFRKKQIHKAENMVKRFLWSLIFRALIVTEVMSNPAQPLLSMKHLPNPEEHYKAYKIEHDNMPHDIYIAIPRTTYSLVGFYLETQLIQKFTKTKFQVSYDKAEQEMKIHWCGRLKCLALELEKEKIYGAAR